MCLDTSRKKYVVELQSNFFGRIQYIHIESRYWIVHVIIILHALLKQENCRVQYIGWKWDQK